MVEQRRAETVIWAFILMFALGVIVAQVASAHNRVVARAPIASIDLSIFSDFQFVLSEADRAGAVGPGGGLAEGSPVALFLDAVIQVESRGDPACVGSAGERGLMQIKRDTWREVTARLYGQPLAFDQAFDPAANRRVGRAYFDELHRFLLENRSAWRSDLRSLLAGCYNAGPGRVERAGFSVRRLPRSTRAYVDRVNSLHDYYLATRGEGLAAR